MDALERAGIKIVFGKHRATKLEKRVDEALAATVRDARARMRLAGVTLPVIPPKRVAIKRVGALGEPRAN